MEIEDTTEDKNFLWYLKRGVILTKDNLIKKNLEGGSKCRF